MKKRLLLNAMSGVLLGIAFFVTSEQIAYSDPFEPNFEVSALDGSNGFVIKNILGHSNDALCVSVSNAGDINNDGISDIIIGDPLADPSGYDNIGNGYLVFGSKSGFSAELNISNLNGTNGLFINGLTTNESLGESVSNAGDLNADGIDDVIIGAPMACPEGKYLAGKAYVVFGSSVGFTGANFDVKTLNGTNGFVINGVQENDQAGTAVSSAGDINGDGVGDILIGAPTGFLSGYSIEGKAYVVFGSISGFNATLQLSDLNGSNGFLINGIDLGDHTGFAVSSLGDVNGDEIDDIIIGAPAASPDGRSYAGKAYVVFGSNSGFGDTLELTDLDGNNGFAINGIDAGDYLTGNSGNFGPSQGAVRATGDVNGDGIDDIVLGAYNASESYVVFGSRSRSTPIFELSDLDGTNGFVIKPISVRDRLGEAVSGIGDINNDGIADIAIGAPSAADYAGQSYVVFGSMSGFSATFEVSALDGNNGFIINGSMFNNQLGRGISGAGDINSDGIDDFIIGGRSNGGTCYVIFGKSYVNIIPGDIDGDGEINSDDVKIIKAYLNQPVTVCPECDIDGDGFITILDARKLIKMCSS